MTQKFSDLHPDFSADDAVRNAIALLSSGGDARITLDPETGLNRYMSAPYPRTALAFASSTANDMSVDAFHHVLSVIKAGLPDYAAHLAGLSSRIRGAYQLGSDCDVVFAPSGTDLEYVALAAVRGRMAGGIHNILLGADEVGRGCVHSAHGNFFAGETALGVSAQAGKNVPGLAEVSLADIPVRCTEGQACDSAEMTAAIRIELELAQQMNRHALVHVVHGSKTGLILPELAELDLLKAEFGDAFTLVVDACQARIMTDAVKAYLARGAIVFLTGSKFMGGAPFSGFALVPSKTIAGAQALPDGFRSIFRRAEWPKAWAGAEQLEDSGNPGLALRIEASIFELERFQRVPIADVRRVIFAFQNTLKRVLLEPFGFALVKPYSDGHGAEAREHPLEMLTLATLDVSSHPTSESFEGSEILHRNLAMNGIRLGQPVKSVRTAAGKWGGTLRVGLSMPQMVRFVVLDDRALEHALECDLGKVAVALEEQRAVN
ncbi:hypothetical protein GCM10023115_16360 [Pontixanthobacter gangjinensis]|uniref:Selenocysteine lyase/cysteine desulfurase n=1 Tax=Pontixanthobacter gangjinensis TaxID=1028742 RepID=A0A6I4SP20_9SPHN|nr:hypothetical protein [Pontixanthobacter gangjinensis]MXO56880.1 hypothetical protein [Pontixanthobacter gangjinensis]